MKMSFEKKLSNEKNSKFVKKLLANTDFSDEKIALLVDVKPDFVKIIRGKLRSKKG